MSYYHLLGIHQYMILLHNLEEKEIKKLTDEAPLFVLMQNIGRYQYVLYVLTEDVDSFCKEFLPDQHFEIYPITRGIPDNYNAFNLDVKRPEPIKKDKKVKLDKKDYKILYHLSKNSMEPIIKLSEKSKLDRKTIQSRINKMLDANIIQKFRFAVNVFKWGVSAYFLKIDTTPENKQKILLAIRSDNYSGFVYETYTGFFMWHMPPSHKELFNFTKHLESIDKSIKIDAMQTADVLKIEAVPKKVSEILRERGK
ncbi:winged helix-turn-helix transcriptional regulator [Candidatus Pacearchaeota archaeon]|nr:winged helix-turn-helix transcriptional regulator [Candidatus Pacearchaeota archaeon]